MSTRLVWGIVLLTLGGCNCLSSNERRLIGTWQGTAAIERHEDGSETRINMDPPTMEVTFTANHQERWRSLDGNQEAIARWRLEGNELVFIMKSASQAGLAGITKREKIEKITVNELIVGDATMAGVWTRIQ